jgi:prepilin-type processing-associated H-X9-DG protein
MMKKIYPLLLAGSLIFAPTIAKAQPPEPNYQVPPIFDYTCPGGQTPELAIEKFFDNEEGPYDKAAKIVDGADPDNPALQRLQKMVQDSFGKMIVYPQHIEITPDPKNPDSATAHYRLVFHNDLGFTVSQDDSAKLEKHTARNCTYWMIVPNDPSDGAQQFYGYKSDDKESGFTTRLATLIAYPQKSLTAYDLFKSESNVKQILLGLMQYEEDYDNQINLNPQNYKDGLMPYIQSYILFTAPGDVEGTVSYNINPNLFGLYSKAIQDPWTLVSIYQGHDQKLDFKYGGYAVVGFMDGHVKAVTPEEAKDLRWKP